MAQKSKNQCCECCELNGVFRCCQYEAASIWCSAVHLLCPSPGSKTVTDKKLVVANVFTDKPRYHLYQLPMLQFHEICHLLFCILSSEIRMKNICCNILLLVLKSFPVNSFVLSKFAALKLSITVTFSRKQNTILVTERSRISVRSNNNL